MAGLKETDRRRMGVDERRPRGAGRPGWAGAAFMVESLVLLAAIVACMAVFASLFAKSAIAGAGSTETTRAVQLAQNAAEEFSSDPASVAAGAAVGQGVAAGSADGRDGLHVSCEVSEQGTAAGAYYTARITVTDDAGKTVYALDAARYVKGAR